MIKLEISVEFPFKFCEYCGIKSLTTDELWADGEVVQRYTHCRNQDICINAMLLRDMEEEKDVEILK